MRCGGWKTWNTYFLTEEEGPGPCRPGQPLPTAAGHPLPRSGLGPGPSLKNCRSLSTPTSCFMLCTASSGLLVSTFPAPARTKSPGGRGGWRGNEMPHYLLSGSAHIALFLPPGRKRLVLRLNTHTRRTSNVGQRWGWAPTPCQQWT